jgi:hypothetical protein
VKNVDEASNQLAIAGSFALVTCGYVCSPFSRESVLR